MHVQVRLVLLAIVASWILEIHPFIAPALSAEPLQEVVMVQGKLGIDDNTEDYDPWEPFNAKIFTLNCALDRYVLDRWRPGTTPSYYRANSKLSTICSTMSRCQNA